MTKDRIIIFVAVVLMAASLGGAALLMPHINHMRRELQLVANDELMKNLPPKIAITQAALGSFRGLAVDVLWGRVTQMKQEGKFYEAMQLSDWITQLQPRFPEVWRFHAWNMSYNISVATYTPQERWMWVRAGIDLLREEGIPLNPNSVLLYRELGWIFLHKVGQFSDDGHWYYKQQMAQEWTEILGPPPEGSTEKVIEWFRPVAEAYEAYINVNTPAGKLKEELVALTRDTRLLQHVAGLQSLTVKQLEVKLPNLRDKLAGTEPELAQRLDRLIELVQQQLALQSFTPMERLLAANPDIAPLLEQLTEMGFSPDRRLLNAINVAQLMRRSENINVLGLIEADKAAGDRLRAFLDNESIAKSREKLLAFVRASVIADDYHMDPLWMLELMEGEWFVKHVERERLKAEGKIPAIPLDWRHPAAHGLYWAALGVKRAHGLLRPGDFDVLNTDRQVIHSMQLLTESGQINYDPIMQQYTQLPDPRYIDAYHHAIYGSMDRVSDPNNPLFKEILTTTVAQESFEAGHENFLVQAVQIAWLYGDQAQADQYYQTLRTMYSKRGEGRAVKYSQPVEQFVLREFVQDEAVINLEDARAAIVGMLTQAIDEGLVNGRMELANRYMSLARDLHRIYQEKQNYEGRLQGVANRVGLPPFEQMEADAFLSFLRRPAQILEHLLVKARAWRNAPAEWKLRVYDMMNEALTAEAVAFNLQPLNVYPVPAGMEAWRKAHPPPPTLLARPGDVLPPLPTVQGDRELPPPQQLPGAARPQIGDAVEEAAGKKALTGRTVGK